MTKAKNQAERYVRALPADEGNPPFVLVVDVGHTIELYADFSRLGKTYVPFPDSQSHRLKLADLAKPEIRERLAKVWTDPLSLDPSRRSAKVTRDVADRLARLAKSLELSGHPADSVAADGGDVVPLPAAPRPGRAEVRVGGRADLCGGKAGRLGHPPQAHAVFPAQALLEDQHVGLGVTDHAQHLREPAFALAAAEQDIERHDAQGHGRRPP
jgi:hypothetical protein